MTTNLENEVTVLAYHFWDDQGYDAAFGRLALAVRETWRHCGQLRTVLVVNKTRPCIEAFAAENREVEVQVEPSLVPGDINSMSADCNSRLWTRFSTPYVLVIQADGYPLRGGLEEFVGKYDFTGAPYVRDSWWKNLVCRVLNYWVQNGGFSLRSRRICEAAAKYWNGKYAARGWFPDATEDLYYTKFLPLHEREYRRSFRLATNRESLRFSWDALVPIPKPETLPFGFHRMISKEALLGNEA